MGRWTFSEALGVRFTGLESCRTSAESSDAYHSFRTAVSLLLLAVMGPKAWRTQKLMPSGLVTVRLARSSSPAPKLTPRFARRQILSAILLVRFGMRLL